MTIRFIIGGLVVVVGIAVGQSVARHLYQTQIVTGTTNDRETIEPATASEEVQAGVPAEDKERTIKILAVGDVMLGRSVNTRALKYQDDAWPFMKVAHYLTEADLTLGNLENPLVYTCPTTDVGMLFCGRAEMAVGLAEAGFDVVSLANNHAHNFGEQGLVETEEILANQSVVGLQPYETTNLNVKGIAVGVLGLDDVSTRVSTDSALQALEEMDAEVSLVIIHWGNEYQDQPNERQVSLGRRLIDGGADVVIGAHPHWIQPVERYRDKLIFYSLGNFVFDQMWSEETRLGGIATITFRYADFGITHIDYDWQETKIFDYGQPELVASDRDLPVLQ